MPVKYQLYDNPNCFCPERILMLNRDQAPIIDGMKCNTCVSPGLGFASGLNLCCDNCFQLSWPGFTGANDNLVSIPALGVVGSPHWDTWYTNSQLSLGSVSGRTITLGTNWMHAPNANVLQPCTQVNGTNTCGYPSVDSSSIEYRPTFINGGTTFPALYCPDIWGSIQQGAAWCGGRLVPFAFLTLAITSVWHWADYANYPNGTSVSNWISIYSSTPRASVIYTQIQTYWSINWTCAGGDFFIPPDGYVASIPELFNPVYINNIQVPPDLGTSWSINALGVTTRQGNSFTDAGYFKSTWSWPNLSVQAVGCTSDTYQDLSTTWP